MFTRGKVGTKIFIGLAIVSVYFTIGAFLPVRMLVQVIEAAMRGEVHTGMTMKAILMLLVILVIGLGLSWFITLRLKRQIVDPLKEIERASAEMAKGNLSCKVQYSSNDEIGGVAKSYGSTASTLSAMIRDIDFALNKMSQGDFNVAFGNEFVGDFAGLKTSLDQFVYIMTDTLKGIKSSAGSVDQAANQVAGSSQGLADGATQQAGAIEELSTSVGQVTTQINQNVENSKAARVGAIQSLEGIESTKAQMEQLLAAMKEINDSSSEIGKIIKTIEDIAFQTNILALNAAVEAARAGAAGKGFAVVADEVRNLASKSAEAANNTTELIETSIAAVDKGVKLADETAQALLSMESGIVETRGLIEQVSVANEQQAKSVNEINQSVEQISGVVQINSAASEESAAASQELLGQADVLENLVKRFNLNAAAHEQKKAASAQSVQSGQPVQSVRPVEEVKKKQQEKPIVRQKPTEAKGMEAPAPKKNIAEKVLDGVKSKHKEKKVEKPVDQKSVKPPAQQKVSETPVQTKVSESPRQQRVSEPPTLTPMKKEEQAEFDKKEFMYGLDKY